MKRAFTAWISAWAVTTFASASIRIQDANGLGLLDFAKATFDVADAVTPLAKISFGGSLAIAFLILYRLVSKPELRAIASAPIVLGFLR